MVHNYYSIYFSYFLLICATKKEIFFTQIKDKLQNKLDSIGGIDKEGCFVKLSCRSAKDVTLSGPRFEQRYKEISEREASKLENLTEHEIMNLKIQWLYKAHTQAMRIYTAEEALSLLLQSRRIYWDLTFDLKFPEKFSTHIIIRKWENIPLESEYRIFVKSGKVTAISQYFTQIYFPAISQQKDVIKNEILAFWEKIRPLLMAPPINLSEFVIDFAWIANESTGDKKYVVLELNPLNVSTGAALFNWESEKDSDIIDGLLPMEFRINEKSVAHFQRNKVHPDWVPYIYQ